MDDEDIFEDVPTERSLVLLKDVHENKASRENAKLGKSQPMFLVPNKPIKVPSIPLYRPTQPTIDETKPVQKCSDKEILNVFTSMVPTQNFSASEKSFGHEFIEKNNYTNNTLVDYQLVDPDNKSNETNSARSNVSNMRDASSGITNQKLDASHQPEYGGYKAMKDRITSDSTTDNRFNKAANTTPATTRTRNTDSGGCSSTQKKSICLWGFLFLLLLLILGILIYYVVKCSSTDSKTIYGKTEDDTTDKKLIQDGSSITLMTAESMESSKKLPRLNPAIFPTAYYITIVTDFIRFEYNLRVHILIYINEITNIIIIHGTNYNLNAYVGLIGPENEMYDIASVNLEFDTDMMVLTLNRSTVIGEYDLTIHYSGVIETEIGGYYRISYKSPDSYNISWLALTDFKPNKAHLLFPCFDHPMFMATFSLVFGLLDSKSFTISNMGKAEQRWKREIAFHNITDLDVFAWVHYATTPLIPTMGLAFIVVPNKDDFSVKDRNFVHYIYRKHLYNEMEFAMNWTDEIVKYFESYFNSSYSLQNLHIFSVPNLNPYGVGSWGIILLSESQILNDPIGVNPYKSLYPVEQGKQVILSLSHKLVTQWFGTGVTMSELTDDWIFEGFAIYMKYRALNRLSKDWTELGHFNIEITQPLLLMESLLPTSKHHEIHDNVPDAAKGAVLMHIMETMITTETFDMAMMKLAGNKKLQISGFMDICELLSDEAQKNQTLSLDLNLCDFLKPYVKQRGYPVLKLSRNYVTNGAMITQQQFILGNHIAEKFSEPSNESLKHDEQLWIVPTSIINKGSGSVGTQPKIWVPQKEEFSIGILTSNDWALLNPQASGLYRVNYDQRNWDMIKQQLDTDYKEISSINRAQIIDDVLNLARANMVDYYLAFETIQYLSLETEYIPWAAALNNFEFFDMMFIKTPQYGVFKKFVSILISDVYDTHCNEKKETNKEAIYVTQLRNLIGQWACHLDHPACIEYSIRKFYQLMSRPEHNPISVEERYMVYCTAIRRTTYKEWDFLWHQYLASNNQYENELILKALACTHDPWIIELYLWHMISSTSDDIIIQPIHYSIIIEHLSKNPVASSVVLNKLLEHWKSFRKLSRSNTILSGMVKHVFFYINTDPEFELFKNWFRKNGDKMMGDFELFQHIEAAIENNIFFMKTYLWQVVTWMQSHVQNNTHRLPMSCSEEIYRPGFGTKLEENDPKILGLSPTIPVNKTFSPNRPSKFLPESPIVFVRPIEIDKFSSTTETSNDPLLSTTQDMIQNDKAENIITVPETIKLDKNESTIIVDDIKIKKDDHVVDEGSGNDLENFVNALTQSIPEKNEEVKDDKNQEEKVLDDVRNKNSSTVTEPSPVDV